MNASRLFARGYHDLVCVIPPRATTAPTSHIRADMLGKVPGKRRLDGRWHGYDFTTADLPTMRDCRQWDMWRANVGMLAARYPSLDIDIDDEQQSREIMERAIAKLGPAPVRRSRAGRRLLIYKNAVDPFPKVATTIEGGKVEALCEGRQYLVAGIHPSGAKYTYDGRPLWDWRPEDLSGVTQEQVYDFMSSLGAAVREPVGSPVDTDSLRAPSLHALSEVVRAIPNDVPDREDYVSLGIAIKAAGGDEAIDLWREWCARWTLGHNDPETVDYDWTTFKPPFRIGWAYLQRRVRVEAREEFTTDTELDPYSASMPMRLQPADFSSHERTVRHVAHRVKDTLRYCPESDQWHIWMK